MTSRSARRKKSSKAGETRPTPAAAPFRASPWLGPGVIAVLFVALAVWSWRKWPDPLIDFGRELYTPWQLAEGKLLYRDVGSFFGPLSQYWNALLFKIFGVSLTTLVFANLAILALTTALLYKWLGSVCDRLTAAASAVILLTVFSFSQYTNVGNYNFVTPYAHEATHGVALAVAMIYFFHRWLAGGHARDGALTGLALGLALLAKPEVALAAAAGLAAGIFTAWRRGGASDRLAPALSCFAAALLLPTILFFIYFRLHAPSSLDAARYVLAGWRALWSGEAAGSVFYLNLIGLDQPAARAWQMFKAFAAIALCAGAAAFLDVRSGRWIKHSLALCGACGGALFLILILAPHWIPWPEAGRPLPILVTAMLAAVVALYGNRPADRNAAASFAGLVAWGVFSLALLGKVFLNVRLYHYGFYLALPATLFVAIGLLWVAPALLRRQWGGGRLFQAVALAALGALVVFHLGWSENLYRLKTFEVGAGGDRFFAFAENASPRGAAVVRALRLIDQVAPGNATFVVLPEGVMLNYLARRANPTPFINFMVPELRDAGEANIVAALETAAPDFIVVTHKNPEEYGVGFFGKDPSNGKAIMDWVGEHYTEVALIGAEPLRDSRFGIKLLRRIP
jgi:hypothetical protein